MRGIHNNIIQLLSKQPMSLDELHYVTGYSKDGLRGRLSELRKQGYNIELHRVESKKYFLKSASPEKQKILDFIEKRNLYQQRIKISKLAKAINIPLSKMTDALVQINKEGKLLQMSNTEVLFKKQ